MPARPPACNGWTSRCTPVGLRLRRRDDGWLGLERSFRFEYSEDGQDRHIGRVVLRGGKLVGFSGPTRAAQSVVRGFHR